MTLPDNFNHGEHLIDVIKKVYNKEISQHFRSVEIDEIRTDKQSLRTACTVYESDAFQEIIAKMLLFYITCRRARDIQAPIYGVPKYDYDSQRTYRPYIRLYFRESIQDTDPEYRPIEGEITFTLINETSSTITKTELTNYGNKIKQLFGASGGFLWRKGKEHACYRDREKGYNLQILCRDEAEGKRVIEQVLDIRSHSPDWQYLNMSKNEEPSQAFPTIPPKKTILGKSQRMPRRRPIADVRFRYATCHIHGNLNTVTIYDRTGLKRMPLVSN